VHVAVATGADGVHVGEHDLPVGVTRKILGDGRLLGATARDATTALAHQHASASYLGVGPCFATSTKTGLPMPLGCEGLRSVTNAVSIPVIAIAGITAQRVPELLAAGAYGVAVIGAVWNAEDPHAAVERLLRALGEPA
jgi:thiamine-phosphate pyrophosphorylase